MMTVSELLESVNKDLELYEIVLTERALGEDGKYVDGESAGYGLLNKVTGVMEHTSTILPGVMWQATHFETTLKSLTAAEGELADTTAADGDVVPFGPH